MGSINDVRRRRVNKERVWTVFKLDLGDAEPNQTIPFVMTVLSNLSGASLSQQGPLDNRELVGVTRDNFKDLFAKFKPQFHEVLKNHVTKGDDLEFKIDFKSMADFTPEGLVQNVPALKTLMEERVRWNRLKGAIGQSPEKKKAMADLAQAIKGKK